MILGYSVLCVDLGASAGHSLDFLICCAVLVDAGDDWFCPGLGCVRGCCFVHDNDPDFFGMIC